MSGESYCQECSAVMSGLPHNCTRVEVTRAGLTDKEMQGIMGDCTGSCDKIANAQLKKVGEWGNEPCYEHLSPLGGVPIKKHICIHCWQVLLEEVKE